MKSLKSSTYDLRFFWFHTQKYICIVFPPLKDGVYVVIVLMGYLAKTSKIPKSQEQLFLPCSFLPMRKAAGPRPVALNQGVSRNEGLIQLLMPNPSTGSNNRKGGATGATSWGQKEWVMCLSYPAHTQCQAGELNKRLNRWARARALFPIKRIITLCQLLIHNPSPMYKTTEEQQVELFRCSKILWFFFFFSNAPSVRNSRDLESWAELYDTATLWGATCLLIIFWLLR